MKTFFAWILTVLLSFGAGRAVGRDYDYEPDTELDQKVRDHIDVIVDEAAGIVDDVSESARERRKTAESEWEESDTYKKGKKAVDDVTDAVGDIAEDIDERFGSDETESESETSDETEAETENTDEAV